MGLWWWIWLRNAGVPPALIFWWFLWFQLCKAGLLWYSHRLVFFRRSVSKTVFERIHKSRVLVWRLCDALDVFSHWKCQTSEALILCLSDRRSLITESKISGILTSPVLLMSVCLWKMMLCIRCIVSHTCWMYKVIKKKLSRDNNSFIRERLYPFPACCNVRESSGLDF